LQCKSRRNAAGPSDAADAFRADFVAPATVLSESTAHSTETKEPIMFVELDTRHNEGLTVSLEWDRDTGQTQIVVNDARTALDTVFAVPRTAAADAFRHPFRYAP
jgi:hypothetical protein